MCESEYLQTNEQQYFNENYWHCTSFSQDYYTPHSKKKKKKTPQNKRELKYSQIVKSLNELIYNKMLRQYITAHESQLNITEMYTCARCTKTESESSSHHKTENQSSCFYDLNSYCLILRKKCYSHIKHYQVYGYSYIKHHRCIATR